MGNERFCTTIGGGNDGNWLVPLYDNLTQQEQGLLNTLHDSYTYQHSYYDIYDYLHHPSHTDNTDYTGHVQYWDETYGYYQYKADEQYYGNISFEFKQPFADYFDKYYKNDEKDEPYYYHSDHLGSAAWITDAKGLPVQYFMYAPYGEQLLNQQSTSYNERFTFTGKERDAETGYDYFGARNYLSALSIWGAVDPLADKYIYNSPYVYCEGNPIKFVDPDGSWFETAWDLFNLGLDIHSLKANVQNGNVGEAMLDAAGLILDAGAVALPVVTAGVGVALKLYRTTDKVVDAGTTTSKFRQAIMRGVQSEQRVLKEMRLSKNTKKMVSRTNSGKPVNVIPDAVQDGVMYEVKDTKAVYNTKQIQGEYNAAKEAGYEFKIVTGEKTHISKEVQSRAEIIRRSDLGPQ